MPKQRKSTLHAGELVLLVVGFCCLFIFGFWLLENTVYQKYQNYKFQQRLEGQAATVTGFLQSWASRGESANSSTDQLASLTAPKAPEAAQPDQKKPRPRSGTLLGRIDIPRVKISAVVREGVDNGTLRRAVGHIPETALAGEGGNFVVAAHRDTHFRGLRAIREGDEIRFVTDLGIYKYVVEELMIVWPEHVEVLDPTPASVMTLVTCYPFNYVGSAPKRFIVRARQTAVLPRGEEVAGSAAESIAAGSE